MGRIKIAIVSGIIFSSFGLFMLANFIFSSYSLVYANSRESNSEEFVESTVAIKQDDIACSLSQNYPKDVLRWCGLIEKYALKNGLQPELLAAVIMQESGGDPDAYSSSGAVGLMQVMPRDGIAAGFDCANGPCFANRPSMQELFDPEFNISYGSGILIGLLNRTGDLEAALMSYGPMDTGRSYAEKVLAIMENY